LQNKKKAIERGHGGAVVTMVVNMKRKDGGGCHHEKKRMETSFSGDYKDDMYQLQRRLEDGNGGARMEPDQLARFYFVFKIQAHD
jgi:hypothetical protein